MDVAEPLKVGKIMVQNPLQKVEETVIIRTFEGRIGLRVPRLLKKSTYTFLTGKPPQCLEGPYVSLWTLCCTLYVSQ